MADLIFDTPFPRSGTGILERWNRLPLDQRQRLLDRLSSERKRIFRQRLEDYNRLSPETRERLREQAQAFCNLPPERQEGVRRLFHRFSRLPEDRREMLREELRNLKDLPETERRARIASDECRNRYTSLEQQLLRDISRQLAVPAAR